MIVQILLAKNKICTHEVPESMAGHQEGSLGIIVVAKCCPRACARARAHTHSTYLQNPMGPCFFIVTNNKWPQKSRVVVSDTFSLFNVTIYVNLYMIKFWYLHPYTCACHRDPLPCATLVFKNGLLGLANFPSRKMISFCKILIFSYPPFRLV